jgi:hypothetical protein
LSVSEIVSAPPARDPPAELQKPADLYKQRVLTNEEFGALKKKGVVSEPSFL